MLEKLGLLKIADCRAPNWSRAAPRRISLMLPPGLELSVPTTGNSGLTSADAPCTSGDVGTGVVFGSFPFPLFSLLVMIDSLRANASAHLPGTAHSTKIVERNDQRRELFFRRQIGNPHSP